MLSTSFLELNHSYMQTQDSRPQNNKPGRNAGPPQELMQYWGESMPPVPPTPCMKCPPPLSRTIILNSVWDGAESSTGYKFESLSTLPRPWGECSRDTIENRDKELVNNNIQYGSVTRTGIGTTSLILGGEVDCVLDSMPDDPDVQPHWVELKTSIEGRKDVQKWVSLFPVGHCTILTSVVVKGDETLEILGSVLSTWRPYDRGRPPHSQWKTHFVTDNGDTEDSGTSQEEWEFLER